MNIIISIVLLSLLVLFIGSWIMFFLNFINSKYNNSTTSNADSVKLGVQQCYNTVLIALYKMYVDQDIIDYTSYAESLNANTPGINTLGGTHIGLFIVVSNTCIQG